MVVRAIFPHSEFDPNGDYANDQAWRLLTYNWTDVNHDGTACGPTATTTAPSTTPTARAPPTSTATR